MSSLFRTDLVTIVLPLMIGSSCTPLFDHSSVQCRDRSDCERFEGHPECIDSVCVPSGLAPTKCFFATSTHPPVDPADFLNQCSNTYLPSGPDSPPGQCLSYNRPIDPGAMVRNPPAANPTVPNPPGGAVPAVRCQDMAPSGGSVLYLTGSSNFKPLLEELAPFIVKQTNLLPVFKVTTSCTGVRSMNPLGATYASDHTIRDPDPGATDNYAQYFLGGRGVDCLLGPDGATVDVGESEIYPETCGVAKNTDNVAESPGPVLAILFVVPQKSAERAISAEAARQVFGGGGGVMPWEDHNLLYIRGPGTATLRLIGLAIGIEPTKFWGIDQNTAETLALNLRAVTDPPQAQKAIGLVGADFYDRYRGNLKALAFQATGQKCAYLPDSSLTSRDKINVRDGHYPIWGRLHFFTALASGKVVSEAANMFVSLFTLPMVPQQMLDAFISSSFVPDCAMNVRRDSELGTPVSAPPAYSCGCYFDATVNLNQDKLPPGCTRCLTSGDCTDPRKPACNFGFCEAQ